MNKNYNEETIRSLDWKEHIRLRPGMYIGKLGDGSSQDDGIYILIKEIIDNGIDEHIMGFGKTINVRVTDKQVEVRDYGRGIPLGKVIECVSKINTGGKYDSKAFQKSVGLNGVGTKAANALSIYFRVESVRDGKIKIAEFKQGELINNQKIGPTKERNGTKVIFVPDPEIFHKYHFLPEYLESQIRNYTYLNAGLIIKFNGEKYHSDNGLLDLINDNKQDSEFRYPVIHLKGDDIEIALTHGIEYGETYFTFVNGQHTTHGGTHLAAFREAIVKTIRDYFKKEFNASDIRASIIGAISVRIQEPVFESQTKTKLGSMLMGPEGPNLRSYIIDFVSRELDNYLHRNTELAEKMLKRIQQSERERKDIAGIKKLANQRAKKANLHNKKLRDCRIHYTNRKNPRHSESMLFITEGDSASGSLTKARDVQTQAVFSLRGKPLNCFGLTKKVVYENEEFNLLQHALDIENGLDELRFNQVVISTDADVDGMHIRLLLLTFFLQFYPDLVRQRHLFILETPLFRVRNKKTTLYCYSEEEKQEAMQKLGVNPEITRFKGLGEISPSEFKQFISSEIRLAPVLLKKGHSIQSILAYYMGKNTQERQDFIIENLRVEKDVFDHVA